MKESMAKQLAKLTGQPLPQINNKPEKRKRQFQAAQEENLQKGHILFVPLSEEEGLVVKGGYPDQNKFITIVGIATDGSIIGSLLINTDPNETTPELRACQYQLRRSDYPMILDYNSWLDCSQLFRIPINKILAKGKYCGKITNNDWGYIERFLVSTDVLSNAEKREFGII